MFTDKERIDQLEKWCYNLQAEIDWLKRTPISTINTYNCSCAQSEVHSINGGLICARCNKPLYTLPNTNYIR